MTYLPNSIERCTPIVGFDPYAYIMDRPSNLHINKMQSPYQTDYFAVGPDKSKENDNEAPQNQKKKGVLGTILKTGAAITAIGLAVFGITHLQNAGTCALRTIGNGFGFAGRQLTRLANFITSKITPPTPPTP